MTTANIDGRYIIFPEGGTWEYRRIRDGEVVSQAQEADMGSIIAGRGPLAWLADIDFDSLPECTDEETCIAILEACGWAGRDPQMFVVCPVERD